MFVVPALAGIRVKNHLKAGLQTATEGQKGDLALLVIMVNLGIGNCVFFSPPIDIFTNVNILLEAFTRRRGILGLFWGNVGWHILQCRTRNWT